MKYFIKYLVTIAVVVLASTSLFAKPTKRIFPDYTGIQPKLINKAIAIYTYPDEYAALMTYVKDKNIRVVGQNNDWYKIILDGEIGWVNKADIQVVQKSYIPYSKVLGEEIVDYGKQFIGTPYVWGGNDLKTGVDCSGLTKEVFETFDINITRLASTQVRDGKIVAKSELRPGDLVFFDTTGKNTGTISHVGIYAGDNMFLHADGTNGVMLSNLNSPYYARNYVTGSRIINS